MVGGRIGLSKETLKHLRKIVSKLKIDTSKVITHRVKYGLKKRQTVAPIAVGVRLY